ncbi:MAG TPA: hypothetical protein VF609_08855 [Flavisolibacter sp.]
MKLLIFLLSLCSISGTASKLALIDRKLEQPVQYADDFAFDQYINKTFPVYVQDVPAVIEGAEKAAKKIERGIDCNEYDTVNANHTRFIIYSDCKNYKSVSVRIVTTIKEQNVWCDFELIRKEDKRKAQQHLLNFSTYLAK